MLGRRVDGGAVVRERERAGLGGASDRAVRGGADHAVLAIGVGSCDRREFVAGQFGGLLVVEGGLGGCRGGWERSEFEQRCWGGGAVEPAVGAGRALGGAVGAGVVGADRRQAR